jgi:hypothetical protein
MLERTASVPIPKFVSICGTLSTNFGIDKDTSKSMILVPLFEPDVRKRGCRKW